MRISGRVMSEPPAPSEPRDSSSVATTMPMYSDSPPLPQPPYSSGIDRPKAPISPSPAMMSSGMSSLWRWMCSAIGLQLVVGEAAEGVLHQLEVAVEVAGAGLVGQLGERRRGRARR